jgi:hypothetical protein
MSLSEHIKGDANKLGKMIKEPASKEWFAKHGLPKASEKKKSIAKKTSPLSSEKKERSNWRKMQSEGDRSSDDYRG